ncbi:MAG: D-alanine--D-alanine ligase family protein [Planctomycetota bacterium]|jgi:D-alanine--D-alanine ligase
MISTADAETTPVAVVYGGPSEEREVSLESGAAVADALEAEGWPVRRLVIEDTIDPFVNGIRAAGEIAFLVLHGRYGEDGTVQEALERAGIAYTGSGPAASRAAMDKPTSKRMFQAGGVETPKYYVARHDPEAETRAALRAEGLAVPLVVKPAASGSSIGVTIVRDEGALREALGRAGEFGDEVLVEAFVEGRELTVGVLEEEALPVVELLPAREFYDYSAKYEDAGTRYICPAELSGSELRAVEEIALAAFRALGGRDFGRVDVMLGTDGRPSVLEVNTIPGFTSHSLLPRAATAAGVPFGELVGRIAGLAEKRAVQMPRS